MAPFDELRVVSTVEPRGLCGLARQERGIGLEHSLAKAQRTPSVEVVLLNILSVRIYESYRP